MRNLEILSWSWSCHGKEAGSSLAALGFPLYAFNVKWRYHEIFLFVFCDCYFPFASGATNYALFDLNLNIYSML